MHWADRLAIRFVRSSRYPKFFSAGWGDQDALELFLANSDQHPEPPAAEIHWSADTSDDRDTVVRDGIFQSPSPDLPPEIATARVRWMSGRNGSERVCLLMPATNDHGYVTRSRLAKHLARSDVASLMLESPFYGSRKVSGGGPHTVLEAMILGRAAATEGLSLARAFQSEGRTVGVSGYSMGGSISAVISALSTSPLATAPLAASHSPAPVFCEGVLRQAVDWAALGGATAQRDLADVLGRSSALLLPPPVHASSAIFAVGRDDGYIPPHAITSLHRHWPGSELRWLRGGHASIYFVGFRRLAGVIVEAFERLQRTTTDHPK